MGKNMIILPYEKGKGFSTVHRILLLNGGSRKVKQIRNLIVAEINEPEEKQNKVPWGYWLGIGLTFLLIIVGIAGFSFSPYNYILLILGMVGFTIVGILFCRRFAKKTSFTADGLKILDSRFGKEFNIIKVYENKGPQGKIQVLRQLRIGVLEKNKVIKKKKTKRSKKSKKKVDNESFDNYDPNQSRDSNQLFVQQASHKKINNADDGADVYSKRETNPYGQHNKGPRAEHDISKSSSYSSDDDNMYLQRNNQTPFNHEDNNLIYQNTELDDLAPHQEMEYRDPAELNGEMIPQNFYNPNQNRETKIENYENYKANPNQSRNSQSNPYNVTPIYNNDVNESKGHIPVKKDEDLVTYEIDLNDFEGKEKKSRRR